MPSRSEYAFLLTAETFRFLLTLRASDRQVLDQAFQLIVDHPHLAGDYQERDEDGRPMEVSLHGHFLVTFWADHAVKEVRVVRVERI